MPNGEAHDDQPKSKASRSLKTPLQKEALEAAYSSEATQHPVHVTHASYIIQDQFAYFARRCMHAEREIAMQSTHCHRRKCGRLLAIE